MATVLPAGTRVPGLVALFDPLARRLLGRGVPLGPNALITIRGRKSGVMRTTPVALVDAAGKRWVIGTFGETNWVRNLRAVGEAELSVGKRQESVRARALSTSEAAAFFSGVLVPYIRSLTIGTLLIRMLGARDILEDPSGAALTHPVFELTAG